ncbi:MAG: ATP phosphoribosyltransferase regulatory subunit [Peptococcaceae bacterium]
MPLIFEKPIGTKDILPEKLEFVKNIITKAKVLLEKWGYEEIETPIVEYHETVGFLSKIQDEKLIKFLDPLGKTVILRPDFTAPIARFVSSVYQDASLPVRLMYQGKVYRNSGHQGIDEMNQIGLELIGLDSLEADAEVITLAVKLIIECSSSNFGISIGHTKFLNLLFQEIGCSEDIRSKLFAYLLAHDYVGYKGLVQSLEINENYQSYLMRVLKLRGTVDDISEGKEWFPDSKEWQQVFRDLADLWGILKQYKIAEVVCYDLSLVGRQNYYTGLIYHVYCEGHPYPICSGGRYDGLLQSFGRRAPATGFAVNIDDLLKVLIKKQITLAEKDKILIIYSEPKRLAAIQTAEELRSQGKVVIMVLEDTISDNYRKGFREVIRV